MNKKSKSIIIFENIPVRRHWDEEKQEWYFSVIDVISVLTDSVNPRNYWKVLKNRLNKEGSELVTKCNQLKMLSADGKKYKTDCLSTENILRLVQSIPSKKAEPVKMWLAKVGNERINETYDPELAIQRALLTYLKKGYTKEWVDQRLKTIEIRKELTNEWEKCNVKEGLEFAILTDEITKAWTDGLTTRKYKKFKELTKENLRDNMTNLELVLNMLAEVSTTEISKEKNPETFEQNKKVARQGGEVAGNARKDIEKKTGKKVITNKNAKSLKIGKKIKSNQKGVAALLTIVIIAAATLIMALNSSLLGLGELDLGYTKQKGGEASSIADACIEESLRRLRLDSNYSGGSLNINDNSCIINIQSSGNNRTITTTSTVDIYHKKIKVEATLSGSNTAINSWQEISE